MMPAIEKAFDLTGDDIVDLSTENKSLKKRGFEDKLWLEESEVKPLKQNHDQKKANLNMARKKNNWMKLKKLFHTSWTKGLKKLR